MDHHKCPSKYIVDITTYFWWAMVYIDTTVPSDDNQQECHCYFQSFYSNNVFVSVLLYDNE